MSLGQSTDRSRWDFPPKKALSGYHVRLEPQTDNHQNGLWRLRDAPESFAHLRYGAFATRTQSGPMIAELSALRALSFRDGDRTNLPDRMVQFQTRSMTGFGATVGVAGGKLGTTASAF